MEDGVIVTLSEYASSTGQKPYAPLIVILIIPVMLLTVSILQSILALVFFFIDIVKTYIRYNTKATLLVNTKRRIIMFSNVVRKNEGALLL